MRLVHKQGQGDTQNLVLSGTSFYHQFSAVDARHIDIFQQVYADSTQRPSAEEGGGVLHANDDNADVTP